jgi:hypothetical protein
MILRVAQKSFPAMENHTTPGNQGGFLYLGILFAIFILSIAVFLSSYSYKIDSQREREFELLFIGHQFEIAIESYYNNSPDGIKDLPLKIEDLLLDKRTLIPLRHLRKIYIDPMTNSIDWGLIKNDSGGIVGIYSLSESKPLIKSSEFYKQYKDEFNNAQTYSDWKFTFQPNQNNGNENLDSY